MLIDVNCSIGHWPFMDLAGITPAKLARNLAAEDIDLAMVSPLEAALFPDPDIPSRRLIARLARQDRLLPVPVLDPTLSHWRDCLAFYRRSGAARTVKLMPNYHRYRLSDAPVRDLVEALFKTATHPVLMIQMRLEDERNQYPLMKIPGVSVEDVAALAHAFPRLRIVCLCAYFGEAERLARETRNVFVDTAFIEHTNTLKTLLERVPAARVLFGSHTPILYTRSNIMKMTQAEIPPEARQAIACGNARKLFRLSRPAR